MQAVVISFTEQGYVTAKRLEEGLNRRHGPDAKAGSGRELEKEECRAFAFSSLTMPLKSFVEAAFKEKDALIFVGAAGIAVRSIAPFIREKTTDPAVLVVDELGRYCIPILSGHIGGANELACEAARILGGSAVITTATDLHGAFAVDVFARKNNLAIESMERAKRISASLLAGKKIGFFSDFPVEGPLPEGLTKNRWQEENIYITQREEGWPGEDKSRLLLRLVPRTAVLGMGCRREISLEALEAAAATAMKKGRLSPLAVCALATVERKKEERALLALAEKWGLKFLWFSPQELEAAEGSFEESAFVRQVTGVGNICERAAVCGAASLGGQKGASLAVGKTARDGATAAVALAAAGRRLHF